MIDLWYKNAVIYCIDVETFQDGNGDGVGDFIGLSDRLPYLAGIGVTCVWLLPFYPSPVLDDGYDVADYYGVRPELGTLGDFVDFMNQARELGIRVIVDLVVNHTSNTHAWFQAARRDPNSFFREWYVWSKRKPRGDESGVVFPGVQKSTWTYDRQAGAYYFHRFYDFQPDLNLMHHAVRQEIEKIMGFWLQLGVSGFRIDAAPFMIEQKGTGKARGPEDYAYLTEFRQFLSWRRGDAMMLAEANVPPNELMHFFGDEGDRMQLLFNFVVNRQLFLAVAREQAAPLIDAYRMLPEKLPPTAQWANFLRNNDEIDLSGLSDEDRALCFQEFGPEPTMQLYGRGIRRRLSPMLKADRRRLELMNSLMFTLPGTPVIRYGEEIGMGDDLSLPERSAIRTPMQWSAEPNGGFSSAARLVRPVISEGEYRYERVNVASERLEFDSFLNWMERAIRTRKECPEFGWGQMQFLETNHPSVLAHSCEWRGGLVLAVHNFSRAAATVKLALPDDVVETMDLYGRHLRQPTPGASHVIDLDGYDYRWLRLRRAR